MCLEPPLTLQILFRGDREAQFINLLLVQQGGIDKVNPNGCYPLTHRCPNDGAIQ